jgi:hypothetical protein
VNLDRRLPAYAYLVRELWEIDRELRLMVAVRRVCREDGIGPPRIRPADDLLDERIQVTEHATVESGPRQDGGVSS